MSLADGPQFGGVHARVSQVFRAQDERRRAYLDLLVKVGGKCRGCGRLVTSAGLAAHPGACSVCFRNGLRPDPALMAKLAETQAVE